MRFSSDEDKKRFMSVGTATVHGDWFSGYLLKQEHLGLADVKKFLYIEVMVTDQRTLALCKGFGAASGG